MPKKLTYSYVKDFIEKEGYQLLSDTYKNNKTKLLIKCPEGHEYEVTFKNFSIHKSRCPICIKKKISDNQRFFYDYVKNFIEKEGYTLLSDTYKNNQTKLLTLCPEGHKYKVTFGNFYQGKRCSFKSKNKHLTYDYVKNFIEKEGYTLLSDTYKNNRTKLKIKCNKNHIYKTKFAHFKDGSRCPICNFENQSSKAEKELQNFVESMGYNIIRNDRTQIINPATKFNLELDIWIPSLNKAIEYNGTYWHNKSYQKVKDQIKKDQCKQKGIDLLIVKDYNWINNRYIEESIITKFLNIS